MPDGIGPCATMPRPLAKDRQELLHVDRDRDRLAQLPRALGRLAAARVADHRVEPVEADVEHGRGDGRAQPDAEAAHLRRERRLALDRDAHRLVEIVRADARSVVVALQELVPVGNALLLPAVHDAVDEGHRLAGVGEQPGLAVAGRALGRVRLAAEVRVALQHHAQVGVVLGQHVGTGADRPPVEREVLLRHAGLGEEAVDLPRHRREERHRQPVCELRVASFEPDAEGVRVDALDAGERILAQVEPFVAASLGAHCRVRLLEPRGELGQADDVLRHEAVDRRGEARVRKALDLVDVIVGGQLARAASGQRVGAGERGDLPRRQRLVEELSLRVPGERRMRLVEDSRPDVDLVLAVACARCSRAASPPR